MYFREIVNTLLGQGVAITERNRTGPPWSVGRPTAGSVTDDNDRHQGPLVVWPAYTMCRRASNNEVDKLLTAL